MDNKTRLHEGNKKNINDLQPWEALMKKIVWLQLGKFEGKKILDFGSGLGITADYLAENNDVVAIEPSIESVNNRWQEHHYQQLCGSTELLKNMEDSLFDVIICHNDFEKANSLLDGSNGVTSKFGEIHYYEDADIEHWCPELKICRTMGMRTFWDLQQNQEIHKDIEWQSKMIQMELRVSDIQEYQNIAFFHHLIIKKRQNENVLQRMKTNLQVAYRMM